MAAIRITMNHCRTNHVPGRVSVVVVCLLATLPAAPLLRAQSVPRVDTTGAAVPTADGDGAITADDVRRHIGVLAHDSMRGRTTPSERLEKAAQYLAEQFKALGLLPGATPGQAIGALQQGADGRDLPWTQRYPISGTLITSSPAPMTFTARLRHGAKNIVNEQGAPVEVTGKADGRLAVDSMTETGGLGVWAQAVQSQMLVLTGLHTPESMRQAKLRNGIVLYVPPASADSAAVAAVAHQIRATTHVVILANEDSATFERRQASVSRHPPLATAAAREHRGNLFGR